LEAARAHRVGLFPDLEPRGGVLERLRVVELLELGRGQGAFELIAFGPDVGRAGALGALHDIAEDDGGVRRNRSPAKAFRVLYGLHVRLGGLGCGTGVTEPRKMR
jgi:hypothetical protein